jgi:hypothetical protein
MMQVALLSSGFKDWPILRQTPGRRGIWANCQFHTQIDREEFDYCVIYDGVSQPITVRCSPENLVFVTAEPPSVRVYDPKFVRQFGSVITCNRNLDHPRVIYMQTGLPWHVGRRCRNHTNISFTKDYDELKNVKHFNKHKLISVICSDKTWTTGQRKRLDFVRKISVQVPQIEVFGRGLRHIEDKWDAIAGYKYHVVLENQAYPDYWTEKLSDAFLGGAYPFYYGCPNISDYFPTGSYTSFDIGDIDGCKAIIEDAIANSLYERSIRRILEARDLVLDKYNLFAMLSDVCNRMDAGRVKKDILLRPESEFVSESRGRKLRKVIVDSKKTIANWLGPGERHRGLASHDDSVDKTRPPRKREVQC